ncbi:oxidoreductase [Vairimorpha necatrix]|uniref:Oxidoreductase n=1 Tax=Vairimorpha necatrix TaxID=6039 RepID=A0AAX4J8S4_9MICR
MNICIVGGGPSGLFLAKYLAPNVNNITIYDKDATYGGLYRNSHDPKMNIFDKIIKTKNIKFIPNYEIKRDNFKDIESKYDKFVVATGGIPNFHKESGLINSLDVIQNKVKKEELGKNICILGMGNVALDICKKLLTKIDQLNPENIDICSRSSCFLSKFGNNEMRDILKLANIKTYNLTNPSNLKEKRRHDLLTKTIYDPLKSQINLRFNTEIRNIKKKNGKFQVEFQNGDFLFYDSVISSWGFKPNPLELETNKPVYRIGWCEKAYGNINDALNKAKELSVNMLKHKTKKDELDEKLKTNQIYKELENFL